MSSGNPNENPYSSKFSTPVYPPTKQPVAGRPIARKVRLGFFEPFFESITFLQPQYWFFWLLCFVGAMLAGMIPIVLIGPMYCGLGLCFLAKKRGEPVSFDLLFKGFDHFVPTLVPVLIYMAMSLAIIPVMVVGVVVFMAAVSSGSVVASVISIVLFAAFYIVFIALMMVLSYGIFFSSFLVAEYQLDGMEAFKLSFEGLQKNFFGMLGVAVGGAILSFAGALACYIPLILMIPMFLAGPFICYQKIFSTVQPPIAPNPVS